MIRNFITIAYRNFIRNRFFSIINLLGLSIGIASCLLIFTYVSNELSYEEMHPEHDQIFRVLTRVITAERTETLALTANKIAAVAEDKYPEVESAAKVMHYGNFRPVVMQYEDKIFYEKSFVLADPAIIDLFAFEWVAGDPQNALQEPFDIILSESLANKYFGDEYPIGKVIEGANKWDLKVTGVYKDFPGNTIIDYKAIIPMESFNRGGAEQLAWFPMNYFTFLKLTDAEQAVAVSQKLNAYAEEDGGESFKNFGMEMQFQMQGLDEIYLTEGIRGDGGQRSSITQVYAFLAIGIFILLIASINYINLTTAKSEKRAREVGIRKVMGAYKKQLIIQFYGETFIITFLALIIAIGISELSLPYFNNLANKELSLHFFSLQNLFYLLGGCIVLTIISGIYPSIYLSSFSPVRVLKGTFRTGKAGDTFRQVLVAIQFIIAVVLIIGVLVISEQIQYTNEKKLGYEADEMIMLPLSGEEAISNKNILKDRLLQDSRVSDVTMTSERMGTVMAGYGCLGEGMDKQSTVECNGYLTDIDFFEAMRIPLLSGTGFTPRAEGDSVFQFVINQTLATKLGWKHEEAVGKTLSPWAGSMYGKVVGVVPDFHFNSLKSSIEPLAIWVDPEQIRYMYVKINMDDYKNSLAFVEQEWLQLNPNSPFEFSFMKDELRGLYDAEIRAAKVLGLFTVLSIIIGCLGLFGLTTYILEKRTKEIGIRKVLGASTGRLLGLMSWEFVKIVLIANLIAWPLAWFIMQEWLSNFAYHIEIGPFIFIATLAATLIITIGTVLNHAYKTATANPVLSIRDE